MEKRCKRCGTMLPELPPGTKRCNWCGATKRLEEFSKNSSAKDGKDYACRECKKVYQAQYVPKPRSEQD